MLDTSKDNPENFLVKLTPEKSPSKSKKTPAEDLELTASPTLENKCRVDASDSGDIPIKEKRIVEVNVTEDKSGSNKFDEVVRNPKNILSEKKNSKVGPEGVKSNQKENKMTTPVRKGQSKENTRPSVISGLRKGPPLTSNVKAVRRLSRGFRMGFIHPFAIEVLDGSNESLLRPDGEFDPNVRKGIPLQIFFPKKSM